MRSTPLLLLLVPLALLLPPGAAAQAYDPETQSPWSLLAVPADGLAYHQAGIRARALVAEKKWAEAEPLVERLVREYPRDGRNWILLGRVKQPLGKHAEAAAAYDRAGPLVGWQNRDALPEIWASLEHLAAGNRRAALDVLRRSVFEHRSLYRDVLLASPAFKPLWHDPEFREIAGRPDTTGWGAAEGRRRDVDHLRAEVMRLSPDHHGAPPPAEFTRRYQELRRNAPAMPYEEFVVGLNRMLAALRQGHTELLSHGVIHHLPVQFYAFPEGLFVVRATDGYADLVGSRVAAIGGTPAEEALRRVNLMQSVDGDMQYLWTGAFLLRNAEYLKGSGIVPAVDTVEVTLEGPGGGRRAARLVTGQFNGWSKLPAPRVAAPPLWMRRLAENHWEEALPEHDALYVQMNQVGNDSAESLPEFGRRLWTVLDAGKPANLVLDLRHNNGGSTSLYTELLRTVVAFTREPGRRLYVLIGRNTYSAAANLVTDLERLAGPVFVGEASSECCNFHGDPGMVRLPYSGLGGPVSAVRWNLSGDVFDGRREMSPHVPVQLTARAYFAGEDPALDTVFRLIHAERRDPARGR